MAVRRAGRSLAAEDDDLGAFLEAAEGAEQTCRTLLVYSIIISRFQGSCFAGEVEHEVEAGRKRRD